MEDVRKIQHSFYNISGFPGVLGAIDGTHIRIQSPGGANAEVYRNRKGYFSINTQLICDAQLKIMAVDARWGGSVHDQTIFDNSAAKYEISRNPLFRTGFLVGDGGYGCQKYLLTPLVTRSVTTAAQKRYQKAQISTRNPIERCNGVLKRRFPALSTGLRINLSLGVVTVVACCVLHNIAIELNDSAEVFQEVFDEIDNNDVNEAENFQLPNSNNGSAMRDSLIQGYFSRLQPNV
jgi:nuclease HARBI1